METNHPTTATQFTGTVRVFETGATRDQDETKDDPEGFISPLVIDRFNQYMTKHRHQSDGRLRDSDNWQKGMPLNAYMKSGWRHFHTWWLHHRGYGYQLRSESLEEALCGILFNAQGYLHELLKARLPQAPESGQVKR
jgi:hypothetical protein